MNTQIAKDKWPLLRAELHNAWRDLSFDDLDRTNGSIKSIYGIVHAKCGLHEEEIKDRLVSLMKKYGLTDKKNS